MNAGTPSAAMRKEEEKYGEERRDISRDKLRVRRNFQERPFAREMRRRSFPLRLLHHLHTTIIPAILLGPTRFIPKSRWVQYYCAGKCAWDGCKSTCGANQRPDKLFLMLPLLLLIDERWAHGAGHRRRLRHLHHRVHLIFTSKYGIW